MPPVCSSVERMYLDLLRQTTADFSNAYTNQPENYTVTKCWKSFCVDKFAICQVRDEPWWWTIPPLHNDWSSVLYVKIGNQLNPSLWSNRNMGSHVEPAATMKFKQESKTVSIKHRLLFNCHWNGTLQCLNIPLGHTDPLPHHPSRPPLLNLCKEKEKVVLQWSSE